MQRLPFRQSVLCAAIVAVVLSTSGFAQTTAADAARIESPQELMARLTPEQNRLFQDALRAFGQANYARALTTFKELLKQLPGEAVVSKFAAEAALNTSETQFAIGIVKPIADSTPEDWQAVALLTRACAQLTDVKCRDTGMAHMLDLHKRSITPQNMLRYIVERIPIGDNTVFLWASLEPWGPYRIYYLGQVLNMQKKIYLRTTVESSDGDQSDFAREHPKEAAAGLRAFSIDAYAETGLNSSGQRTQTHYTYGYFVDEPSYDVVREKFLAIAQGKARPLSSRTGLVVP